MLKIQRVNEGSSPSADLSHLPHVLLVLDGFPKALGGGERVVLRLAAMLPRFGYRVSVLTFAIHPESEFSPADAPCPVYLLPLTNTYGLEALQGAFALRQLLRRHKVRIVQTFFESSDIWAGAVTRLLSSAKLVWSRRDMGILRSAKHRYAYRAMRRFPHAVAAVSARVAEHVITVDRVPSGRVHVVHNGLDLQVKAPDVSRRKLNPRQCTVTTIGNVRRVKGHDLLVDAAARIHQRFPEVRFSVAGGVLEPDYYDELQRQVAALGLSGNFSFLGNITDLSAHLAAADIFVLPSRSEGFSNALIEAMAAGLPTIATDVGGNSEAIANKRSGLIVPPEDASALARAIETLLENPEFADSLSQGGRQAVEQNFSSDAMMRGYTSVFSKILAAGPEPRP